MQVVQTKLWLLGTGGTIAGQSAVEGDNVGYTAGTVPVDALLPKGANRLLESAGLEVVSRQLAQLDSKDMTYGVWFALAEAVCAACDDPAVRGVVITHGTDTIEETAYFLAEACRPVKPVVLTCAMRPATAVSPDGPQNLLDAMAVASDERAGGVVVVTAGAVHRASSVSKVHPYRIDAFSSGEQGPLAMVEEGRIRWLHQSVDAQPSASEGSTPCKELRGGDHHPSDALRLVSQLRTGGLPRVEWVVSRTGVAPREVEQWLVDSPAEPVRGLIVVGTGNGTFHQSLAEPLKRAEAAGMVVWRTTRCTQGPIVLGSSGVDWPRVTHLDPVKARIALALCIARADFSHSAV